MRIKRSFIFLIVVIAFGIPIFSSESTVRLSQNVPLKYTSKSSAESTSIITEVMLLSVVAPLLLLFGVELVTIINQFQVIVL